MKIEKARGSKREGKGPLDELNTEFIDSERARGYF